MGTRKREEAPHGSIATDERRLRPQIFPRGRQPLPGAASGSRDRGAINVRMVCDSEHVRLGFRARNHWR
jgi:hypothetical protein